MVKGIAARRRRATRIGAIAAVTSIVVTAASVAIGTNLLYNSTQGRRAAGPDLPSRPLPETPNLLLGVATDGELGSVVVLTLAPSGQGGSVVTVPANASPIRPADGEAVTLADSYRDNGEQGLGFAVTSTLGVSFDQVAVIDVDDVVEMLEPVGDVQVDLPADVVTDIGGTPSVVVERGTQLLELDDLADALGASWTGEDTADIQPAESDENVEALWDGVAGQVGGGLETGAAVGVDVPPGLDNFLARLFNGSLSVRRLASDVAADTSGDGDRDRTVTLMASADVLLVFGQISPRKVAAALDSFSVRLVVPFAQEGISNSEVALQALSRLTMANINVVSVSTAAAEDGAPEISRVTLLNRSLDVADDLADVVGEMEMVEPEFEIPGVDVVVTLGNSALAFYDEG